MIIAIDGPAGAGKSTVAKLLAERLGFQFLDTGAMYRAITWTAMTRKIPLSDTAALEKLASEIQIAFVGEDVVADGVVVTEAIRRPEVTKNVGAIADVIAVRAYMVQMQRQIASQGNFVCEGRDQGTVAFPDSKCKIYLDATPEQRAQRRLEQLRGKGQQADFDELLELQNQRDAQDKSREIGGLQRADDAIEVSTEDLSIEQVVDLLEQIARKKMVA